MGYNGLDSTVFALNIDFHGWGLTFEILEGEWWVAHVKTCGI